MKWILISGLALFLLFMAYTALSTSKTPTPKYDVLKKDGHFEIRMYDSILEATFQMQGNWGESSNNGFRILANYIFGGNEKSQSISMTTPVKSIRQGENMKMSFSMPSGIQSDNYPKPNNDQIKMEMIPARKVAIISFGGFASEKDMETKASQLKQWLSKNGLEAIGDPEYLRYNPPYQLIARRNEVLIPIK
jgi:hypothetical protein